MDTNVALRNRTGFDSLGMRMLYGVLYPFFHCKSEIPPEILAYEEPVVFVCNHYELFGPIALMTSLRARFRVWSNERLLEAHKEVEQLVDGAVVMAPVFSRQTMKKVLNKLAPLVEWIFERLRAIPVSRSETSKMLTTMRKSVQAMEAGESIIIFPEKGEPHYALGSVSPFYSGFAMLGEFAGRKLQKPISFCPIHIDKAKRRMCFGKLVQYIPGNMKTEAQRVSDRLYEQMQQLALEAGYRPIAAIEQEVGQ